MKRFLLFALLGSVSSYAHAQQKGQVLSADYSNFSLSFSNRADVGGATLPLLTGRVGRADGERFGVIARIGGGPLLEIIDGGGAILRSITAADLLGAEGSGAIKLVKTEDVLPGRFVRSIYEISLPGGKRLQLSLKALAAGNPADVTAAHPLFVTYALSGPASETLALRVTLPIEGGVDVRSNGFVASARTGSAAFSGIVSPKPRSVESEKGSVVITGEPVTLNERGAETGMMWIQFDGTSATSPSSAKAEALATLQASEKRGASPNIIVVSVTDRPAVLPKDTVHMMLVYTNVGTQSASGVVLRNPIPMGTEYVTGSALGEGMEVGYDRTESTDGAAGEINAVRWTMSGELKPGEERLASFRTVVR